MMLKKYSLLSVALLLSTVSAGLQAEIYRTVDANGVVSYTDQRPSSGKIETVDLPPLTTVPEQTIRQIEAQMDKDPQGPIYSQINIQEPKNEETFQNPEVVRVKMASEPARLQSGDQYRLLVDGQTFQTGTRSDFVLESLDRGSHTLQPQIVSRQGKVVLSGPTITIYVHRAMARNPQIQPKAK